MTIGITDLLIGRRFVLHAARRAVLGPNDAE
jgi:hypothetical protein